MISAQSWDEDYDDDGGLVCLSKLCEFGSFAKTGPELKHSRCPGCCPVVNSRKLSSSFESESWKKHLVFKASLSWGITVISVWRCFLKCTCCHSLKIPDVIQRGKCALFACAGSLRKHLIYSFQSANCVELHGLKLSCLLTIRGRKQTWIQTGGFSYL